MLTRSIVCLLAVFSAGCIFGGSGGPVVETNNGTTSSNNGSNNSSNNQTGGSNNGGDPELCGNGELDLGETCDPCDDYQCPSQGCALFVQTGSADTCDIACVPNGERTACADGDGCCPDICSEADDSDCSDACGNGVVEDGETCDGDCPTCPPSRPCSPVVQVGDPSTCDVECVSEPAPDNCCEPACEGDQVCIDGQCKGEPPSCTQQPLNFCETTQGPGFVCDQQSGQCVEELMMPKTCAVNQDCLPWQYCSANLCVTPSDCYEAGMLGNNSMAFCAWEGWTSGQHLECSYNQANGAYECMSQNRLLVCMPDASNGCHPWEGCASNTCAVPDSCDKANEPNLYCVFETERRNAQCVNGNCIQ